MAQSAPHSARLAAVGNVAAAPSALDQLGARYEYRRPPEVVQYLRQHPHLVPLLVEAADVIPHYFGAGAALVLEVFTDPEDNDPRPELFAVVQTTLGPVAALDRLDRLGADWWFAKSPAPPSVLVIDVEFV